MQHSWSSRLAVIAALLLSPGLAIPFLAGCDGAAEAEERPGEQGKRRYQRAHKKFKAIDGKLGKLQRSVPLQTLAYTKLRSAFNFAKIDFEAKAKARLHNVTQDVYHAAMKRLESIEKDIKKYPR